MNQTQISSEIVRRYPVLCVDDDRPNLVTLRLTLEPEFSVICAGSAPEAQEILESRFVAVLVTDQRMPGTTGVDLCETTRHRFPEVQRVLITAYSDMQSVIDAINRGGVFRYLLKPWDPQELRMVLRESIARIHLERMVQEMRHSIMVRERDAALAAMRGKVLHDLGNIHTVMTSSCWALEELLQRRAGELPHSAYEELSQEVESLRASIDYVTSIHREAGLGAGMPVRTPRQHRVRDILKMVVGIIGVDRAHDVKIIVDCPDEIHLMADYTDINRVLVNLVMNAIQAIEESGKRDGAVHLSVRQGAGAVQIHVVDNGPGIPREARDQIFECGFTSRSDKGGTGFGLAICKELVAANGGSLDLVPDAQEGSIFLVRIPDGSPTDEYSSN